MVVLRSFVANVSASARGVCDGLSLVSPFIARTPVALRNYSGSAVVPWRHVPLGRRGDAPEVLRGSVAGEADESLWLPVNRIASDFTVGLYVGFPSDGLCVSHHRCRRTIGDLTGQAHEPFSRGESNSHHDAWPTANRVCRRSDEPSRCLVRHTSPVHGGWCFVEAESRILPRSCSLAPSSSLFKVTLAAYLHKMKFEEQVLDGHGPAEVGFGCRAASPFIVGPLWKAND